MPFVDGMLLIHGDGSVEKTSPSDMKPTWQPIRIDAPEGAVVFAAESLSKSFGKHIALAPFDLNLRAGSVTAVTGDNGSGKTSLLWEAFRSAKNQSVAVAMVPQNASDLLFLNTLAEELAEADCLNPDVNLRTASRLERFVGRLNPSIHPRDLSAGQQLALVLSIQLGTDAQLVILDEPTRGLDLTAKQSLASWLLELRDQGKAILVASHDIDFISAISTRRLTLDCGIVMADTDED
jgi:energy-coupling factor transport system ATP-binding protein